MMRDSSVFFFCLRRFFVIVLTDPTDTVIYAPETTRYAI